LPCFKLKAAASQQLIGQLPFARIAVARLFLISGIDYVRRYYVPLFICMATKTTHLELVPNLISEAFIAAMKRCIARRTVIDHLCRDNGSNFVGGSRESKALFRCAEFLRQTNDCSKDTISVAFYSSI